MILARVIVLLSFILSPVLAAAETVSVLMDFPEEISDQQAIKIVRQAFLSRGWDIKEEKDTSISAKNKRAFTLATIKVSRERGRLVYVDSSMRTSDSGYKRVEMPTTAPDKWIENLRLDIGKMIAAVPLSVQDKEKDPVSRLKQIKEMLNAGLINQDDYESKKKEILDEI